MRSNHLLAIRGAGGGGKSGDSGGSARAPVESPDSLRSIQYARVLDLVSEGEIEGLVSGAQSILLDGTPLQNADGSFNFAGVTWNAVVGTQAQSYIPGFPSVESEHAVSAEVTLASPLVRSVTDANINSVRVTVSVPQLTEQNTTTGDLNGTWTAIYIDVQANGGGYVRVLNDTISGKTTTPYQRSYTVNLTGAAPWDIRVGRGREDSTSVSLQNKTFWSSYTEIIDAKLSYPNSAIVGIEIDASQFNAVPSRGYDLKGMLIQVPSNYDPDTFVYSGVWSGTFQVRWSDNPAWCFYDLLTNDRYGLGNYLDAALIDKWALYSIAQYCDALVPNGFGGTERRFTCNLYLQTREEAYKVLTNMASIFRGMAYWGAGAMTAVADMPSDPVALYTSANVIGGNFSYQGSAKNTRHTVALVTWNDPADAYKQKVEYVEDQAGIARYGVVDTSIVAFGCTSRGQAHRIGKWLLYSERLETETVTFAVGLDGLFSAPGSVINTQDPVRAGVRFGGRIISAVGIAITLDAAVTLVGAQSYTLSAMLPDGTAEDRAVITGAGTTAALTLASAFTADPQRMAIWVLRSAAILPETWRVLAVTESGKAQFQITALKHRPDKYGAVEQDLILEPRPTSTINTGRPDGVTNLMATESLFEISSGVVSDRLTLSWSGTTGRYRVSYRGSRGNIIVLPEMITQTIDIDGLEPDVYTFSVVQVSLLGAMSPANVLVTSVYGKTAAPADVADFTVIKSTGFALAQWSFATDLDVRIGGFIVIRHSPLTSGALWEDGIELQDFPGSFTQGFCPLITGTYMAKAVDSSGNFSVNTSSFVLTEGMITGFTTVGTSTQSPTFPGTKTHVAVVGADMELDGATLIDSMAALVDTWPIGDLGGIAPSGSYAFDTYLDLTTVATRRFEADITVFSFDTGDTIDVRAENIDVWDAFDGNVVNDCDVSLFASITNDNPSASPTWGPWQPFMVADFTSRAARFRLDFVSGQSTHNIAVSQLVVHAKIPA